MEKKEGMKKGNKFIHAHRCKESVPKKSDLYLK